MIAAVAILAVLLGLAVTVHRRRERCERLAAYHSDQARANFDKAYKDVRGCIGLGPPRTDEEFIEGHTSVYSLEAGLALRRAFQHRRLSETYWKAANRPWIALALSSGPSSARTDGGRPTRQPEAADSGSR
jgi:hypothetical protein